jgi:RHS repeat-associated protein
MTDMLLNITLVGQDIMPNGEMGIGQFLDPVSPGSQAVTSFMTQELSDYDLNAPQAYLVYLFFDKNMKLHSKASGMLKVSQSDVLEEHATQQLTMTEDGYFYIYVTNRSNRKVELRQLLIGAERRFRDDHPAAKQCGIDDLRIVHLQGQVRARYDYYSYGLAWNQPINPYDNTYGLKEWQMQEWGDKGIELYQFEARMYDPVLGRWHAPDPLSQFHSPYMANFNNPANFTDPDGRFSMRIGDMIVQATVQLAISISQVDVFAQISNVTIGGTLNGAQFAAGASGAISGVLTVAMAIGGCIEGYKDIMQASMSKIVDKVMGRGVAPPIRTSFWQAHGINWIWMEGPTVSHTISNGDFTEAAIKRDTPGLIEFTINAQQFEGTYYLNCTSQGLNIVNGATVEGRSSPGTFYMALNVEGQWEFGAGDPPAASSVGIGGAVPLIVNGKLYGTTNIYSKDAPAGAPSTGPVPPEFEKFLLQKSSTGFKIQNNKTLGKTIVGYNSNTKQFIIGVQENGVEGLDMETIRDFYVSWGFDNVFSFDGSNSSTLVWDSRIIVDPAHHKNASIPIGITFTIAH